MGFTLTLISGVTEYRCIVLLPVREAKTYTNTSRISGNGAFFEAGACQATKIHAEVES